MSFLASGPYSLRRLCLYFAKASRTTSSTRRNGSAHVQTYPPSLPELLSSFLKATASRISNRTPATGYPIPSADRPTYAGSRRKAEWRGHNASTLSYGAICFFFAAFCVTLYQDYDILTQAGAKAGTTGGAARSNRTDANIAFFVQAYSKTIHLLPALLEAVWHPDNVYAVHVDAEVPDAALRDTRDMLHNPRYANVVLMPREHVTYLGVTTLLGTIDAMALLLARNSSWDYFINLSGADYPLVRPARLRALLGRPDVLSQRLNFVQTYSDPAAVRRKVYASRFGAMWVDTALWENLAERAAPGARDGGAAGGRTDRCRHGCLWRSDAGAHPLLQERTHGQLPIVKTEAWVILHRSFVMHAVESPTARRLLAILANMACPEEFFFGTLLQLSDAFRDSTVFDAFRCVLWTHKRDKGSRPPELDSGRVANVTGILRASGAMFARKMVKRASAVKAYVDAEVLGMHAEEYGATVERRVRCMVRVRWRWGARYGRYVECMKRG